MDAATYAQGLRDFADWVEQNADAAALSLQLRRADDDDSGIRLLLYAPTAEEFSATVTLIGGGEPKVETKYFSVTRRFGPVQLYVYSALEEVCERTVIGVVEQVAWTPKPGLLTPEEDDRDPGDCHREPSEEQLTRTGPYLADSRDENDRSL